MITPKRTDLKSLFTEDFLTGIERAIKGEPDEKAIAEYLVAHRFDINKIPPEDSHLFFYNGIPIGSRGNIVSITGRAKSRKTVVASAIATSCFVEGNFLGFTSDLAEGEIILHVDTEQGYYHYYGSVTRIFNDAGLKNNIPENFVSVHTRDATFEFRIQLTDYLLKTYRPRVMILDGITDYVKNINDQDEATDIGERLLSWSYVYDCLIIVVIHTTKTTGYMTGAVGTHLEKKSQTVIKVVRDDDGKEDGDENVSHVSCQYARDKGFKNFSIVYVEELGRYDLLPEENVLKKGKKGDKSPEAYSEEDHKIILSAVFLYLDEVLDLKLPDKIRKAVKTVSGEWINRSEVRAFVKYYNEKALIFQNPAGAWMRPGAGTTSNPTAPGETGLFGSPPPGKAGEETDDLPF